jgi:hypothetical protein
VKTEYALRYLLLRHLKRRDRLVPSAQFLEVARSLQVSVDRDGFVVTWSAGATPHVRRFDRNAFTFYARGDRERGSADADLRTDNDRLAEDFADEVFGSTTRPQRAVRPESPEAFPTLEWIDAVVFASAQATLGGLGWMSGLALLALRAGDLFRGGHLIGAFALLLLALVGPPVAAMFGAVVGAALQAIDPNPQRRAARVGACVAALVAAGVRLGTEPAALHLDAWLVPLVALVIAVATVRSLYAGHFQVLPLILPFYCLGLYIDGNVIGAVLGIGLLLVSTALLALAHRFAPVQRERALTPNG